MHYQPDKKLRHFYVPVYGRDWFARIVVNHSLDLSHKLVSSDQNYQSEAFELP